MSVQYYKMRQDRLHIFFKCIISFIDGCASYKQYKLHNNIVNWKRAHFFALVVKLHRYSERKKRIIFFKKYIILSFYYLKYVNISSKHLDIQHLRISLSKNVFRHPLSWISFGLYIIFCIYRISY